MSKLKAVVDALFALPPDVIQQEEVAALGAGAVLFGLSIPTDEKAALLTLLGIAYLAVRGIYAAASKAK